MMRVHPAFCEISPIVPQILDELGAMGLSFMTDGRHLLPRVQGVKKEDSGRLTRLILDLNHHRQEAISFLLRERQRTHGESAIS